MKKIKTKPQSPLITTLQSYTLTFLLSYSLTFLASACQTIRYVPIEKTVETKTELIEVVRDTTIYIPPDQAIVKALVECDSTGQILIKQIETLQGKLNAKANIRIVENTIIADCICDSLSIYLQLKDRYQTTSVNTTETKIMWLEKEWKWWQRTLIWCGGFGIFILCFCIIFIISRKILIRH